MATVRQYKITFKNIKEGQIPCKNPTVKLYNVSDNIVQKCIFENNSVTFSIYEDALAGLQGTCIHFAIQCESCGKCPPKEGKICFCNNFTECSECEDCISGICVNRCPDKVCVDDKCQDCETSTDCKNNQSCIGGKCTCPPTLPYFDEVAQKCYGCKTDLECGPCRTCIDGTCVQLNCICDEDTNKCVECLIASDCPLPNQCCVGNKCVCCPGYVWDPILMSCVPKPPCNEDEDLDPCQMCVNGNIEDVICPNPDEICIDGKCGPIPCEGPCDDATDCGPNCGCLDNVCVECASLDCVTCAETIGCKCVNGACQKDNDPCSQFSCITNCGERPDCGCQEDGSCEEIECEGISTLTKNEEECQLVYNLETTKCCECSPITLDNKLISAILIGGIMRLVSTVEVRKGSVTTPMGILNIHRVDEDQYDDIMDNEEPTQGQIQITATYTYEVLIPCSGLGCTPTFTGLFVTEEVPLTPIFDVAGVGFRTMNIDIQTPGNQFPLGLRILRSVTLTYKLISELSFESGCTYDEGLVIGTYIFNDTLTPAQLAALINIDTPGHTSNAQLWIAKTTTSDACRVPEAKWYKADADVNGDITVFETIPFRKSYLTKLTPTTYTDFIDEPDENPGPTDNNGELFSGHYYKVATDCACVNEATAYYESTCQNPGRLVFCDPQEASVTFDPCGMEFTFTAAFITDCLPNYDYYGTSVIPDDAKLRYSIYVNGSETPLPGSTVIANAFGVIYNLNQVFASSELIEFIEIKWSHDNCDECTLRLDSPVELELPTYVITCEPSGLSDVTYTITFFFPVNVTTIVVGSNTATPGFPTITVTLSNSVTDIDMEVTYSGCVDTVIQTINLPENCCDDLSVSLTQDATNCDEDNYNFVSVVTPAISGTYAFSVNNVFVSSNATGLFSIPKNVGGPNEPNTVKVIFTPTSSICDPVARTINIDKTFGFSLTSIGGPIRTICSSGATSTNIVYSVPAGVTGTITYSLTGDPDTTIAVNGPTPITINVTGTPIQSRVISIVSNTLVDGTGNGCAVFTPDPITINFITSPSITGISILPLNPCEEELVTVIITGTAGGSATVNLINFFGASSPQTLTMNAPHTFFAGSAGNMTVTATAVIAGTCNVPSSASTTIVVVDRPEISLVSVVCETPGSPLSNIEITVLGTSASTVTINPLAENITLIEGPAGTYTGVLDDTFNGASISVQITKGGCTDSTTFNIPACACDPLAVAIIHLGSTGGPSITTDSGCEGDTSIYAVTTVGLNGGVTYSWNLNAPSPSGTVLSTTQTFNAYTFDDTTHTLYVTATDSAGCSVTDSITVVGSPAPVFTVNVPVLCLNQPATITHTITVGTAFSYRWILDGVDVPGAPGAGPTYSYTPADLLNHTIGLRIFTTQGCSATVTDATVIATDCCVECATQNVDITGSRVINIVDDGLTSYAPPGVFFFECGNTSQNNTTAQNIEDWLRAIDPCGALVEVTWSDITTTGECKFISKADTCGGAFTGTSVYTGVTINGTLYSTSQATNSWNLCGNISSVGTISLNENAILNHINNALIAEGLSYSGVSVDIIIAGALLTLEVLIPDLENTTTIVLHTNFFGTPASDNFLNTPCTALAGGATSLTGACINLVIQNSTITFDHITMGGDPVDNEFPFDVTGC